MNIAIIGGGAAGFFAAISCKQRHPKAQVTIYEKSNKLLAKVKVSGGGRCNVTNACFNNSLFSKHYPRGEKQLKKAFQQFDSRSTVNWFESKSVTLVAEPDGRMFPSTNDSQTIIDCLLKEVNRLQIRIFTNMAVTSFISKGTGFTLNLKNNDSIRCDKVIIASGGSPKIEGFEWIKAFGHEIIPPVPSLFTFNMPSEGIKSLMGVVADPVSIKVQSSRLSSQGPLLITHWGMSGPAVLKLSAWGARELADKNYQFNIQVNWLGNINETQLREHLKDLLDEVKNRNIGNKNPFQLPNRLWEFLLQKTEINPDQKWFEVGKKNLNRLINNLLNDTYSVSGKTTFKEEFVTCGGVSLQEINFDTMESKKCPGLYFAGEVLDIDGITGGFNFQAAWTTGYIAGKLGHGN